MVMKCRTIQCLIQQLEMERNESGILRNCSFRYQWNDPLNMFALYIDGPITFLAAVMALIGAQFAVRFLRKAGLNRHLTAALFSLCLIDSLFMLTVCCFYSIEANSLLFLKTNIMYNKQSFTSSLHGVAHSMTTASTLLVIWITLQRFLVVLRPMRYAKNPDRHTFRRVSHLKENEKKNSYMVSDSGVPLMRSASRTTYRRPPFEMRKVLSSYSIPVCVIVVSFLVNVPVFFEFTTEPCFDWEHREATKCPWPTRFRDQFARYKAVLMTLTQTVGPVIAIGAMTALTEYKIHTSLRDRRKLFENRNRSIVLTDELKEKVSRTVAIFITVKFLIFRSMPVFFDIYENLHGIESFGPRLTVLVRISDFMVVLNSATNSLAYFGRKTWLENRLRTILIKKEERKQRKTSVSTRKDSVISESRRLSARRGSPEGLTNSPPKNSCIVTDT